MSNVLKKIIDDKKKSIKKYEAIFTINDLKKKISLYKNYLNFKDKLQNKGISVIAEIKKASPSAGIIIQNYNPLQIAKQYLNSGATCLSILTEEEHFKGKLEHIYQIKEKIKLPVLCKDFFIDPYQVYLAKSFGADAILIILAAIDNKGAVEIYDVAKKLDMSIIVEVHTAEEAKKALHFKDAILGINNRDLKTLKTDIKTTFNLHKILINHSQPLVCESGIKTENDVKKIFEKTGINNFLIGESLLSDLEKSSSLLRRITQINA